MGLLPREGRFFDAFNQHAALAVGAARELAALFGDLSNLESRSRAIETFEKQADRVTHETVNMLHQTFITPSPPASASRSRRRTPSPEPSSASASARRASCPRCAGESPAGSCGRGC